MINILTDRDFITPGSAVRMMVERNYVLRDFNDDDVYYLIWWSDRCSCFHFTRSSDGFGGIYTAGTFSNLRACFVWKKEDNDFLYTRPHEGFDEKEFNTWVGTRNGIECEKWDDLRNITGAKSVLDYYGWFKRLGNHIIYCESPPGDVRINDKLANFSNPVYVPDGVKNHDLYKPHPLQAHEPEYGLDSPSHIPLHTKDTGKPRWDLLPLSALEEAVMRLTLGAKKHTEWGWKDIPDAEKEYMASTFRHLQAVQDGIVYDDDPEMPGTTHAGAALASLIIWAWHEKKNRTGNKCCKRFCSDE
jgi:hypothetical protein